MMAVSPLHAPLVHWYAASARDLPWRAEACTAWGVLVSEVMLQQTPVQRVLPVWSQWMRRWPAPADLAAASGGDAVRAWGRLGYPRRALRLHAAAGTLVEQHRGEVPVDLTDLLALPGVGAYTAAAVSSFAFGRRHAVLDTNVRRVIARAVSGRAAPAATLTAAELRQAETLLPEEPADAARWNVALMELGALVCTARTPSCSRCPLAAQCRWLRAGRPASETPARRAQGWAGTDRQVRGAMLARLRTSTRALTGDDLCRAGAASAGGDAGQLGRCLASLVADGLVEVDDGRYALPGDWHAGEGMPSRHTAVASGSHRREASHS